MSLQTAQPLRHLQLQATARAANFATYMIQANIHAGEDYLHGGIDLDAPYQRGDVWTVEQQRLLFKSLLSGIPVPTIVLNDRFTGFRGMSPGRQDWRHGVVDGKQRLTALLSWFDGKLSLPASWFDPAHVLDTHDTDDGPYVTVDQLDKPATRQLEDRPIPVVEATLSSIQAEAELYLLLNRGGVAHSEDDLLAARELAGD